MLNIIVHIFIKSVSISNIIVISELSPSPFSFFILFHLPFYLFFFFLFDFF